MVKSKDNILKDYQKSAVAQQELIFRLKKALNQISLGRLGLFLVEIIIVALTIIFGYHWSVLIAAGIPVLCFLIILKKQVAVQKELEYAQKLLFVFQNEIDLVTTGFHAYSDGSVYSDDQHPYSSDLDIFGPSSLYALINRAITSEGNHLLAAHLGKPLDPGTIISRQSAIAEVRTHIQETFHFRAVLQGYHPAQIDLIREKLEDNNQQHFNFLANPVLRFYTAAVPYLSLLLLALGYFYGGAAWSCLSLFVVFNWALNAYYGKALIRIVAGFSRSSSLLNAVAESISWTENVSWQSPYIKAFSPRNQQAGELSRQTRILSSIIDAFDAASNMFIGPILKGFLLWDFKYAVKLEQWYTHTAGKLVAGLHTISRLEELVSFATLSYNQPDWVFPELSEEFCFRAAEIAHPLIPGNKRVSNSYSLEKDPTVDIITGSNMAGKSTFLRTVGINMVLAFAGSTVCSPAMRTSVFDLLTYMRIKDSLNDQTSTFKAELNRLKMILEGVRTLPAPLVLIDEMLRGTNSKDKYLGSKVFIQEMIKGVTPALFATHDLQLSEMSSLYPGAIRNYHFDIQFAGGEMKFDYRLKSGACKTFNAALLLKEIGLDFYADTTASEGLADNYK